MDVDRILTLQRASRYGSPVDADALLPRVFGNWLDTDAVPDDEDDGGFTPAICVDRVNLIYVINDGAVDSETPRVFWNGKRQSDTVFLFDPANNLEGLGIVATLQFDLAAVLDGEVSVRHGGSVDGSGQPITNPIRGLMAMLMEYLDWTSDDFDRGTVDQTIRDMDTLGYPFYAVFDEELSVRDWLLELLPQFHVDATETGNGQLSFILDRSVTTLPVVPDYHVEAHEIKDFGSPLTAISTEKQIDDLANQITLHARHNWVAGQPTTSYVADYEQSQAAYQAAYPIDFSFRHMYTLAHATQWLAGFVTRHGFEPRVVRFTMHGLKGTVLIPPRLITVEWPPRGWQQRLLKVRKRTTSYERNEVTLECVDCWRELSDEVTEPTSSLSQRREQVSRIYQWIPGTIGDQGVIEDGPGPNKNEAANGDFELGDNGQWRLKDAGGTPLWTIVEDSTKAHQGRFYAKSIAGRANYLVRTLRRRIDPGEWVLVSGYFRDEASGANGSAQTLVEFYGTDGQALGFATGNQVPSTTGYLESVLLAEAPAGAYHFIPGMQLSPVPTTGTWRADKIVANSGGRAELLTKRLSDLGSGNLILNGNFEGGAISWDWQNSAATGWYLDQAFPLSGVFHATHAGEGPAGQGRRLYNFTRIILTPGQTVQVQGWWRTVGLPNGSVRFGMQFFTSTSAFLAELATTAIGGSSEGTYIWVGQAGPVPTDAYYGLMWAETISHTTPNTYYLLDDVSAWFP